MDAIARSPGTRKSNCCARIAAARPLLGDVIGEQSARGPRAHRDHPPDRGAVQADLVRPGARGRSKGGQAELESQLDSLPIEETLHVVRAFSYFSHLLNIAEDAQPERRRRAHAEGRSPRRRGASRMLWSARGTVGESLLAWFAPPA